MRSAQSTTIGESGMAKNLLELRAIKKSFLGVPALRGVDLTLGEGEILSLVGMNGAGKSTLSHIIAGIHTPDSGDVLVEGNRVDIRNPKDAERLGIRMVSQEPTLCENMTVAENIFLNNELLDGGLLLSRRRMREECHRILGVLGYDVDPDALVEDLPLVARGVVSIARAMLTQPRILILDEVTAPLNGREVDNLFSVVRGLQARGIGIIYISHKLQEIIDISTRIVVLRDGQLVGAFAADPGARVDERDIIHLMLGEAEGWHGEYKERDAAARAEAVLLETDRLGKSELYEDVSIRLHSREIVGIAGLKGAGISELMLSLFGAITPDSGSVLRDGRPLGRLDSPKRAKTAGIGMVTNDRQKEGLALMLSVEDNIVISSLRKLSNRLGLMRPAQVSAAARTFIRAMSLKTTGPSQPVQYLSGGNQQKVVVAKWLLQDCAVILIDEPTRGVDVKAKNQIYDLLIEQKMAGKGIMVYSPEVRELLNICDRVLVMSRGRIVSEVARGDPDFNERGLLEAVHAAEPH